MRETIAGLDQEIARRTQELAKMTEIRDLLRGMDGAAPATGRRGRPKGSTTAAAVKRTRNMSPEAKERIAAAQRKRWAAQKAGAATAAKKTAKKAGAKRRAGADSAAAQE